MAIKLTQVDIDWITDRYPNMEYDDKANEFHGEVYFKREYNGVRISDAYSVKVDLNDIDKYTNLPKAYCKTDKIQKIADEHNMDIGDLHINTDGSFCFTIKGDEENFFENGFTIQEFFINVLEEFLFQISYFDRYGKFPWGEYAHGPLGYIEKFARGRMSFDELLEKFSKRDLVLIFAQNRQSRCLCGKNMKLRKCHPLVYEGIVKMKNEIQNTKGESL